MSRENSNWMIESMLNKNSPESQQTTFRKAVESGDWNAAYFLLTTQKGKIDVEDVDREGRTLLMRVIEKGDQPMAMFLLSSTKVNRKAKDESGHGVLYYVPEKDYNFRLMLEGMGCEL